MKLGASVQKRPHALLVQIQIKGGIQHFIHHTFFNIVRNFSSII